MSGLVAPFWVQVADAGIRVNIMFAILNLLPILPLDGGRIMASLLPDKASYAYSRSEPYGIFVLLALVFTGLLGKLLGPAMVATLHATYSVFGFE